ncbi:hypothetical protein Scep_007664 [Stephania cephalantha]|uniref:dual-specificity kinase n=1 Tax=Stephania cephalantha TaxID=152367 RepID=A0AAP0KD06_9MAGN
MEGHRTRKRARLGWDVPPTQPEATPRSLLDVAKEDLARPSSPPLRVDDREGHYVFNVGENLTPRCKYWILLSEFQVSRLALLWKSAIIGFCDECIRRSDHNLTLIVLNKILSKMGEGTFCRVLECWDRQSRELVAVKVIRSAQRYCDAAKHEIDILHHLAQNDSSGLRCVQMLNWFDYRNHICIVFEKLGPSLFDFLRRNNYYPFPVDLVREFGRQLLESVACVWIILLHPTSYHMHDLHLIHTDLKPENVLLISSENVKLPGKRNSWDEMMLRCVPKSSAIKLIDFGSSVFDNLGHRGIVSTRHYRAPEVILGLGWSYPCDVWSVGCILIELCSGKTLFQTHENLEHLAMMESILGPLPKHMIQKANCGAEKYIRKGARLNWPEGAASRESIRVVRELARLKGVVDRYVSSSRTEFTDLLQSLLKYDPAERITAQQALRHPFFRNSSHE